MLAALLNQPTPNSEQELLNRAYHIAGFTFAELAQAAQLVLPADLRRDKGWVGMLIERYLGATAGSRPEPDFAHLGIELKTIPIGPQGQPLETTFVCVAPLLNNQGLSWQNSLVRQKLAKVLWMPIEGSRQLPLAQRRVGTPFLWQPNAQQQHALEQDWQELMDMIVLGQVEQITAKHGQYLQLRPKAANSRILTEAIGAQGQAIMTLPRGFYLKKDFTAPLLAEHFSLAANGQHYR